MIHVFHAFYLITSQPLGNGGRDYTTRSEKQIFFRCTGSCIKIGSFCDVAGFDVWEYDWFRWIIWFFIIRKSSSCSIFRVMSGNWIKFSPSTYLGCILTFKVRYGPLRRRFIPTPVVVATFLLFGGGIGSRLGCCICSSSDQTSFMPLSWYLVSPFPTTTLVVLLSSYH